MRRLLVALGVAGLIGAAVAWSESRSPRPGFNFPEGSRRLVSRPQPNDEPSSFQFAIVSDRTGGHYGAITAPPSQSGDKAAGRAPAGTVGRRSA